MSKHTPGPWRVGVYAPHTVHAASFCIASLSGIYPEKDANTRLIASAPRLLAALRNLLATPIPTREARIEAAKAIGEAEGPDA